MIRCREALADSAAVDSEPADAQSVESDEVTQDPADADAGDERLEQLWEAHLRHARVELSETAQAARPVDAGRFASGLLACLDLCPGVASTATRKKNEYHLLVHQGERSLDLWLVQQGHPASIAATLRRARDATSRGPVIGLRERRLEFSPTWKSVEAHRLGLEAAGGALFWIDQEDTARLLALHDLVRSARSQDLAGLDGRPLPSAEVLEWAARGVELASWEVLRRVLESLSSPTDQSSIEPSSPGAGTTGESPRALQLSSSQQPQPTPRAHFSSSQPSSSQQPQSAPPAQSSSSQPSRAFTTTQLSGLESPSLRVLERLRVASVERIVRELVLTDPATRRRDVKAQLDAAGGRITWLGTGLVSLTELCP